MNEPIFLLRGQDNEIFDVLRETRDVSTMTNWVFWNFWKRRTFPYKSIEEGQTLYFVDLDAREIGVELRVTGVGRVHYDDPAEPYQLLERVFGIGSEEAETGLFRRDLPVPGYLLAVAVDPVAYIGTPIDLDWSKVGGRAGWAAWRTVLESANTPDEAKAVLRRLPAEGRSPAAQSYPIDLGAIENLAELPRAPRKPSEAVARKIAQRAGGSCELAGCLERAEHLDHKYPWAHGGNSDIANLQWLCARHNLEKSDRIPTSYSPDQLWLRYLTYLSDEEVVIGDDLTAHRIRTRNSVYDLVIDQNLFLLWKRGGREVYVAAFEGLDELLVPYKDSRRIEIGGEPDLEDPMFSSSRVFEVDDADPVVALARLGLVPGTSIALTLAG